MKLTLQTLGEFSIAWDDQPVALPSSKRTRALLAYLAMTARPHRRDRLCEVFWKLPDDPRGALRWSLSKIRRLVNQSDVERLAADRERVALLTADIEIDVRCLAQRLEEPGLTIDALIDIDRQLQEPLLDGLDLANQEIFQQWLNAERQEVTRLRAKIAGRLAHHDDIDVTVQLDWALSWSELDPFSTQAAHRLLELLQVSGDSETFAKTATQLTQRFRNAGIPWSLKLPDQVSKADPAVNPDVTERELLARQKIQFCAAADGVRIAYASVGNGTPIVKAANWLSHLEHDWDAPIWSPLFRELARDHRFVRYDERGNGLSDWLVGELSFDAFVTDLETVVDASGVDRFALMGISQGAAVSIAYAVKYPERVSHLILFGGYATGWRVDATEITRREREAIITLTEAGWGQDNPAYRQIFSSTFMPSASAQELAWFNEFQRLTTSPENAARFLSVFGDIDVREQLAQVQVPTLVIHSLGDQRIPVSVGRDIAAAIPHAEFVGLESDGHLLLGREAASQAFVKAVRDFIANN
ncbi:guanylate cyclase [Saccharospirillum sp. MSK14-1]|uniref:alpha/beta hydrolase n=1 Tax=Saccharospirillum sp. MSK14-1 TaxID=1897632 RepID=UPI000D4729B2|nr:alpha/beta hydrolase [Saccharospirillum sp. MSK14-1]PTY38501.1 guanylate cyclase [Saccharospirillum sp. MSK14-1]